MRALSSRAWFWIAQIGGWGAYASSLFLTFLPSMEPGRRVAVLINKELRAVVGIAVSLGLLWLYRRVMPEPEVTPRVAGRRDPANPAIAASLAAVLRAEG